MLNRSNQVDMEELSGLNDYMIFMEGFPSISAL